MAERTDINCAHCGWANKVDNRIYNNGILELVGIPKTDNTPPFIAIMLNCQHCGEVYPVVKFAVTNLTSVEGTIAK